MRTVLLDTGYLLALEIGDDQNHAAALKHWRALRTDLPALVVTSFVFDEVVTFLNSRGRHRKAVELGGRLLSSPSVQFVHVEEDLFQEGWRYFARHTDKRYSLTDCISFVLMNRLGISRALTFDKHFAQAGFQKEP